ncbi:MAG: phosphoribosylaminoimidazolesuccinocarboxamide synthase [Ignavibacteriaceae bacterium]
MAVKFNNNKTLYDELIKKDSPFDEKEYLIHQYTDFFEDGNDKKLKSKNLGERFASINSFFFDYLKEYHIPAAFVKSQDKKTLKFLNHNRLPFSVKVFNVTDKRTAKIFNKKEGEILSLPVFEFHYGNGKDSLISESHLVAFDLCTVEDIKLITRICSKVNAVLKSFFERRGVVLAEMSCHFGKSDEKIYLVDDFTPRSLKVIPAEENGKWVNPYKVSTSAEAKKYTEQLYNLMSA